jgi:hypothetical protein
MPPFLVSIVSKHRDRNIAKSFGAALESATTVLDDEFKAEAAP